MTKLPRQNSNSFKADLQPAEVVQAAQALNRGDVVAIPTETVYGLAGRIDDTEALKKIFQIKSRPFFDPLIVHVSTLQEAIGLTAEWPPLADFLARVFWPGPLTLVLKKNSKIDSLISSGLETVGIRMPNHSLTLRLLSLTGPLAAPSANLFGKTSPSCAEHVRSEFADQVMILDGGPCEIGLESTVVAFPAENEIQILRPGGITQEMLEEALKKWSQRVQFSRSVSNASPGHTEHHYMPSLPLIFVDEIPTSNADELNPWTGDFSAWPRHIRDAVQSKFPHIAIKEIQWIQLPNVASLAARSLYSQLREASEPETKVLMIFLTNDQVHDHWAAIRDRLKRAATINLTWSQSKS